MKNYLRRAAAIEFLGCSDHLWRKMRSLNLIKAHYVAQNTYAFYSLDNLREIKRQIEK